MESAIKMTAQGVRDLNNTGPKKKEAAPIVAAAPVITDQAPPAEPAAASPEAPAC
jgi:hypothetical protein